jgi:hypothetical protein
MPIRVTLQRPISRIGALVKKLRTRSGVRAGRSVRELSAIGSPVAGLPYEKAMPYGSRPF